MAELCPSHRGPDRLQWERRQTIWADPLDAEIRGPRAGAFNPASARTLEGG